MRKSLVIIIAYLVCFAGIAFTDEEPTAAKTKILMNSNAEPAPEFYRPDKGWSDFADELESRGFDFDHKSMQGISESDLVGVDIFVLINPVFTLMDDDKAALRNFVKNGGSLFVLVHGNDTWGDTSNMDSLLKNFGIEFGQVNFGELIAEVPAGCTCAGPNPCSRVRFMNATALLQLDSKNTEVVVKTENGDVLGAISTHNNLGKGKLAVLGNSLIFHNVRLPYQDNLNFGLNIFEYLKGGVDLSVVLSKLKGKNLTAGKEVTLIGKVKNEGSSASPATKVRFALSKTASPVSGAASSQKTLATVDLSSVAAGKRKKVKTKAKIPSSVKKGSYYLLTIVDPKGTSGDSNTGNNYKASKKKYSIK